MVLKSDGCHLGISTLMVLQPIGSQLEISMVFLLKTSIHAVLHFVGFPLTAWVLPILKTFAYQLVVF